MKRHGYKRGDRIELVRFYSFWDATPPQGTVVKTTARLIACKMDRSGKLIRFRPEDLRLVKK